MSAVAPASTSRAERAMAPLWLASLRAPEAQEEYEKLGLDPSERYFPARAAPLGEASLELVVATFFNFSPRAVARAIPGAWTKATPEQILAAQLSGIDRALARAFENVDPEVITELLSLLRPAAEAAATRPEGRPLFAGYASLSWPDEPHLALWHAHYLLREFRGDGHIAVLVAEGLTGHQALALHVAMLPAIGPVFRQSRAVDRRRVGGDPGLAAGRRLAHRRRGARPHPGGRAPAAGDRGPHERAGPARVRADRPGGS